MESRGMVPAERRRGAPRWGSRAPSRRHRDGRQSSLRGEPKLETRARPRVRGGEATRRARVVPRARCALPERLRLQHRQLQALRGGDRHPDGPRGAAPRRTRRERRHPSQTRSRPGPGRSPHPPSRGATRRRPRDERHLAPRRARPQRVFRVHRKGGYRAGGGVRGRRRATRRSRRRRRRRTSPRAMSPRRRDRRVGEAVEDDGGDER